MTQARNRQQLQPNSEMPASGVTPLWATAAGVAAGGGENEEFYGRGTTYMTAACFAHFKGFQRDDRWFWLDDDQRDGTDAAPLASSLPATHCAPPSRHLTPRAPS